MEDFRCKVLLVSMLCAAALSCGVTAVAANDIEPCEAKNEYTVTIPAGQTATLPQWGPSITTGTVLDIKLADTTPDYALSVFPCNVRMTETSTMTFPKARREE